MPAKTELLTILQRMLLENEYTVLIWVANELGTLIWNGTQTARLMSLCKRRFLGGGGGGLFSFLGTSDLNPPGVVH